MDFQAFEKALEELLPGQPEITFREMCAELIKSGDLEYEATHDPYVHAALYGRFAKAKARSNFGRVNTDM